MSVPLTHGGPWFAGSDSGRGRQVVAEENGLTFCIATAHAGNGRDYHANAALIARAPALLRANELLAEALDVLEGILEDIAHAHATQTPSDEVLARRIAALIRDAGAANVGGRKP